MKLTRMVSAFALVAVAAGCDGAPTATATAEGVVPSLNQAPVANIRLVHKKPLVGFFRFDFDADGSYDPDGGSITYSWSSSCYYVANGSAYTYRVDVQPDDTCLVDLRVTDAQGAHGYDQVTVDSYGNITY